MSNNIFVNGNIDDLLSSVKSENIQIPKWFNIINKQNQDDLTSDNFMSEINKLSNNYLQNGGDETSTCNLQSGGGNLSETSNKTSSFNFQLGGGALSETSNIFLNQTGGNDNNVSPSDVGELLNMLTSENNKNFDTVTSLDKTTELENNLKNLLNQAGGKKPPKKKKDNDEKTKNKKYKTNTKSNENSKKTKKMKGDNEEKPKKKGNPGFNAWRELLDHVIEKSKVKRPVGMKIAKVVNNEAKELNPGKTSVETSAIARQLFDKNPKKYIDKGLNEMQNKK